MRAKSSFDVISIGHVESTLTSIEDAPRQGDEGAPDAWLVFTAEMRDGLDGLKPGHHVVVLTWLDRARRDVLAVHPRDDAARPLQGVFSTRSADRPNPIGLHQVEILAIEDSRVQVRGLEAIHGTPILDVKPVLGTRAER